MSTLVERLHELSLIHHGSEVGKALAEAEFEVDRLHAIDDENTRLRSELERLQRENDTLRGLLGNSAKPCPYCGLAAEDQSNCERGFPGCARADDQMLSKHFADGYELERLQKRVEELKTALKELRIAVQQIEDTYATTTNYSDASKAERQFREAKARADAALEANRD